LDNARQLLEAAGIEYKMDHTTGALPPASDAILAWAVREGVTNVIRHSRASYCRIQITAIDAGVSAEITNDGAPTHGQANSAEFTGTGLAGLTDRIAAQGGRLSADALNDSFRLWVELPIGNSGSAEQEGQS
jgi:two-component system sensor histidine kinase DesK